MLWLAVLLVEQGAGHTCRASSQSPAPKVSAGEVGEQSWVIKSALLEMLALGQQQTPTTENVCAEEKLLWCP